jgi:branched-chain amino acid transport system substrate-binding protein
VEFWWSLLLSWSIPEAEGFSVFLESYSRDKRGLNTMRQTGWFTGALVVVICVMVFTPSAAMSETMKVGVLLHLTGNLASFGQMQKNSILMAWEAVKKQHLPQGRSIELIFEDIPSDPQKARSAVENLLTQKQIALLACGLASSPAWQAASVAQAFKTPILIHFAAADIITEQGWEYVFRLNPPLREYGNGLLSFLTEVADTKTAAILSAEGFGGMESSQDLVEYCRKAGQEVVFKHFYPQDATDFRPILGRIKEKSPDVIYMASYLEDAVRIISQCKELDVNPLFFIGMGGGFTMPEFGRLAGEAANYLFSVSIWSPSVPYPGAKEYYDNYIRKYTSPPDYHGAESYAAAEVMVNALIRARSASHESVREALAGTNMNTIMGQVKFDSYGRKTQQNRLPTYLVQWIGGKLETVWPRSAASHNYVYPWPRWKER